MTHPKLSLGIDTGGTFTDGVLLDPITRRVVKTTKVLTTHHDLRLCVAEVLKQLIHDDPASITMVSLSTTLATNAIAEGKRKPVGLLLLGYDADLVRKFNFEEQFGTPHFHFIQGKHGLNGEEQTPLDENGVEQTVRKLDGQVEAYAVVSYAGSRNAMHEERAASLAAGLTHNPVVQANHLSSDLDSIRRATTASLNASLLSNLQEFLDAVAEMLAAQGVNCPVLMVRGDGSVVQAEYARKRPVEIIHSGPATSTLGGQFLAGVEAALVVDIGGTTTDIALVENGQVRIHEKAATVGKYRTCVRTIHTRSFGLGGDSRIRFDRSGGLTIGPERVLPLSHLCAEYPDLRREMQTWFLERQGSHGRHQAEFWRLRREPRVALKGERARKAVELLKEGPQLLPRLLKRVGAVSPVQLDEDILVNQDIIERCGLTPTDLLHVTGEFSPWDVEAARTAVEAAASCWRVEVNEFIRRVRAEITRRITGEIVQFLSGKALASPAFRSQDDPLDRWLFEENLRPANPHLGCQITLKLPLVGIGAPAQAFLPDVARALEAQMLLPEHYEVANAVGAVVGNVVMRQRAEVTPILAGPVITGYSAQVASRQERFESFREALVFARERLIERVTDDAHRAGAENPQVQLEENEILPDCMVELSAWAYGKALSRREN